MISSTSLRRVKGITFYSGNQENAHGDSSDCECKTLAAALTMALERQCQKVSHILHSSCFLSRLDSTCIIKLSIIIKQV